MALEPFIDRACREAHPSLTEWYGAEELRGNFREALQQDVEAMNDAALAVRLQSRHVVEGVDAPAYLPRFVEIESLGRAIAQIGFDADSLTFPHVLLKHHDFAIDSPERVERIRSAMVEAFAPFGIERIWLYRHGRSEGSAAPADDLPNLGVYKRYLAAPISVMLAGGAPKHADRIRMEPTRTVDFYEEYLSTYDTVWERNPVLRDLVRKETLEDMVAYAEADGLRLVYIDGERAGVVAAQRELELGLRAWCMHERLLFTPFRGRGFGRAVLWHFIRSLPAEPDEVVYGTIVPANKPSMRTALRMGRIDVGQSYWLHVT